MNSNATRPPSAYEPPSRWRGLVGWNALGAIIVLIAMGVSLCNVMSIRTQHNAPHKRIVRVMH
jgi:hypothetical protein